MALKGWYWRRSFLMLAITIGGITQEIGAGLYMVDLLGERIPHWSLPIALLAITMIIAFLDRYELGYVRHRVSARDATRLDGGQCRRTR